MFLRIGIMQEMYVESPNTGKTTNYNLIYNNYFTSPDIQYGRAFAFSEEETSSDGHMSYNRFFNNIIHKCPTVSQPSGDHNYFYYNIFDSTLIQLYARNNVAYILAFGTGSQICHDNVFFNNTLYYSDNPNIYQYGNNNQYLNNLFLQTNQPNAYKPRAMVPLHL